MDRPKPFLFGGFIGFIVATAILATGCTGPRQIVPPHVKELPMAEAALGERDGITLQATLLDEKQTDRLLNVDAVNRGVAPVLFVLKNQSDNPLTVRRIHFRLRIEQSGIEPAMPGRAAALLCDSSRSTGAAMAGWLIFGILAAPSIHAAEKKEAASVESHREVIFSESQLAPGGTLAGYLFFECPKLLTKVPRPQLEFHVSGNTEALVTLQLSNPYAKQDN